MKKKTRIVQAVATLASCFALACNDSEMTTGRMIIPPPAPSVRVERIDATPMTGEPAIGDSVALRATYYDSAGTAHPGKAVAWSMDQRTGAYAVNSNGVVVPVKAGGSSFSYVIATIDGVKGGYAMNYRVLGWVLDSAFNSTRQRYELFAKLASWMPGAPVPPERRTASHTDIDAIFTLRCRQPGVAELSVVLPVMTRTGDIALKFGPDVVAERWTPGADGYTAARQVDPTELLAQMLTPRAFVLQYETSGGQTLVGEFRGRDPYGLTQRVVQSCN